MAGKRLILRCARLDPDAELKQLAAPLVTRVEPSFAPGIYPLTRPPDPPAKRLYQEKQHGS